MDDVQHSSVIAVAAELQVSLCPGDSEPPLFSHQNAFKQRRITQAQNSHPRDAWNVARIKYLHTATLISAIKTKDEMKEGGMKGWRAGGGRRRRRVGAAERG